MRCVLTSDINLGYKFRHMTSKDYLLYEEHQINSFKKFIEKCIELKSDIIFIVGNLFGTSKPKNRTIEYVNKLFYVLSQKNIHIFLLPGPRDTPLPFSDDTPVQKIYESYSTLHFLYDELQDKKKEIGQPLYKNIINNEKIEIFTPCNPFLKPNEQEYNLRTDDEYYSIFIQSDLSEHKKDFNKLILELPTELNDKNIDVLLLGGNIPKTMNLNFDSSMI